MADCRTGKRQHPNGATAMREARKLRGQNHGTKGLRAYHCPFCGQWHLANGQAAKDGNLKSQRRRATLHG